MTTEPTAPTPDQLDDLFDLLDDVLRPDRPRTIREEYPLAFREENLANSRVIVEDGRIASHAVFLPVDVCVEGVDLRVGLIGSVATRESVRGRGYAGACLAACEEGIREAGGTVAILWSESDEFYDRRGYVRAGCEDLFVIPTRLLRRRNDRSGIRPARKGDETGLADLHQTLRARSIRPPQDWKALLAIPRMTTLVYERDRRVVAYACCGKGADFEGVVHDWAGPTEEALDLVLEHALRSEREEIVLLSPPYTGRIRRTLRERGLPAHRGALGMMKIVDPEGFVRAIVGLGRFTDRGPGPAGKLEWLGEDRYRLTGPTGAREADGREVLRRVFGSEDEDAPAFPGLPVPFYLRGLDSI